MNKYFNLESDLKHTFYYIEPLDFSIILDGKNFILTQDASILTNKIFNQLKNFIVLNKNEIFIEIGFDQRLYIKKISKNKFKIILSNLNNIFEGCVPFEFIKYFFDFILQIELYFKENLKDKYKGNFDDIFNFKKNLENYKTKKHEN